MFEVTRFKVLVALSWWFMLICAARSYLMQVVYLEVLGVQDSVGLAVISLHHSNCCVLVLL